VAELDQETIRLPLGMGNLRLVMMNGRLEIRPAKFTSTSAAAVVSKQPSGGNVLWRRRTDEFLPRPGLTYRETQVLKFVAGGLTNRQTAAEMGVSVKTVEKHRQSLMDKLRLHDTAALTRFAVAAGITFDEEFGNGLERRWHGYCARRGTRLTGRETQVLKLIADGLVNKQIASELNISIKTVMNHRDGLMKRLDIHQVAGLTRYAISERLITPANFSSPAPIQQRLAVG